jgi:hypothetical protein
VVRALIEAGYQVEVVRPEDSGGEFAELTVGHAGQMVLLDLGRDWRRRPPAQLGIGPVLDLDDAVGSKVAALVDRVYRTTSSTWRPFFSATREQPISIAFARDPGCGWRTSATPRSRWMACPTGLAPYGLDTMPTGLRRRHPFAHRPRGPGHLPRTPRGQAAGTTRCLDRTHSATSGLRASRHGLGRPGRGHTSGHRNRRKAVDVDGPKYSRSWVRKRQHRQTPTDTPGRSRGRSNPATPIDDGRCPAHAGIGHRCPEPTPSVRCRQPTSAAIRTPPGTEDPFVATIRQ